MKFAVFTIIATSALMITAVPLASPQNKNIGNPALKKGSTPCSRRGASYENCRPGCGGSGPNPNPSRGCNKITGCRGGPGAKKGANKAP
ncbi:Rapid alkalinization factor [Colletotrichum siamense]|uniref:Rapid alkalinization factor n=1 Tax=Colletotrichum siamense TaxID=690259 RepID=UPI00187338EC|nr:Rapid alkalinization factor [Colletotrichum siamense]KAF5500173.1 Rapid alkalinization factor [Colletotrichum siamense]